MQIIRHTDLIETPWRNGGGITREIFEVRQGHQLVWRLSMADVKTEGPFSSFAGLSRILTVIDGVCMALKTPQETLSAEYAQPLCFDGGLPVTSILSHGPIKDLNLIYDPTLVTGEVTPLWRVGTQTFECIETISRAIFCLKGRVDIDNQECLQAGDTYVAGNQRFDMEILPDTIVLLVQLISLAPSTRG